MVATFDYDAIPIGYYDAVYRRSRGIQSKWHHLKFARFAEAMDGLEQHLDIGCGPGTFIGSLGPGHSSTGVDIAQAQVDFARQTHGGPGKAFEVVAAGPLPYDDERFDVVTIIELIEHLPPETNLALFQQALRVLKPGGRLLVSTPNYGGAWPMVEKAVNRLGETSYEDQHITHYSKRSLRQLLQDAGASEIDVQSYMGLAPFTACLAWGLADLVNKVEAGLLERCYGLLLFASARRSS